MAMKVKKLKQILAAANDNAEIILATEEGNFTPLGTVDLDSEGLDLFWLEDGGFIIDEAALEEMKGMENVKPAIVFWPKDGRF